MSPSPPVRGRPWIIAALLLVVSVAHYLTPPTHLLAHNIYQRLYYIPLLMACAWFGVRGGLLTAAACAALYSPHILLHWSHMPGYQTNQLMELALLALIGLVGGWLYDRERALRLSAERVARQRDTALQDLQSTVESLRRADRLATLGTLSAGLAHEVRNPLGAMRGAVEILESHGDDRERRREFVKLLHEEINRLGRVTDKWLDYARPRKAERRPTDLNALVRSTTEFLSSGGTHGGKAIEGQFDPALPAVVVDAEQIRQLILNLLLNAIQARGAEGRVLVSTASKPGGIEIAVRDFGTGVPEEEAAHIFEPFYSTREGGSGLGLAVCRHIADAHGGTLKVEGPDGGGARFVLHLPAELVAHEAS